MARRPPPKPSPAMVDRAAANYLSRYATARAHLHSLLMRRVEKSIEEHGGDRAEAEGWVKATLDRAERAGLVNDAAYARSKARGLLRRGGSGRSVVAKLQVKGVPPEVIAEALSTIREEEGLSEWHAACRFVRSRRIGAYRSGAAREEHAHRDLAKLARAGFSYDVAKRALGLQTVAELEAVVFGWDD